MINAHLQRRKVCLNRPELADHYIAVLSLHRIRLELSSAKLVMLDVEGFPLRRPWYALHRKGGEAITSAHTFSTYIQQEDESEISQLLG